MLDHNLTARLILLLLPLWAQGHLQQESAPFRDQAIRCGLNDFLFCKSKFYGHPMSLSSSLVFQEICDGLNRRIEILLLEIQKFNEYLCVVQIDHGLGSFLVAFKSSTFALRVVNT